MVDVGRAILHIGYSSEWGFKHAPWGWPGEVSRGCACGVSVGVARSVRVECKSGTAVLSLRSALRAEVATQTRPPCLTTSFPFSAHGFLKHGSATILFTPPSVLCGFLLLDTPMIHVAYFAAAALIPHGRTHASQLTEAGFFFHSVYVCPGPTEHNQHRNILINI